MLHLEGPHNALTCLPVVKAPTETDNDGFHDRVGL